MGFSRACSNHVVVVFYSFVSIQYERDAISLHFTDAVRLSANYLNYSRNEEKGEHVCQQDNAHTFRYNY